MIQIYLDVCIYMHIHYTVTNITTAYIYDTLIDLPGCGNGSLHCRLGSRAPSPYTGETGLLLLLYYHYYQYIVLLLSILLLLLLVLLYYYSS